MERPDGQRPRSRGGDTGKWLRPIGLLTSIPFLMMFGPLLGYFGGDWLDKRFGTEPYLMILFIVLGFIASGREVWKLIQRASRDTE
jgi:F0F1-type ATP synthase assembly protein I